jgi:CRISPR/Cas system-associated endonuclease/helicase Cas3
MNHIRQRAKEAQKEQALIAWASQSEEQMRASIRSDQEWLNNAKIKLDQDEVANDIAERDGHRKDITKIRLDERCNQQHARSRPAWYVAH